MESIGSCRFRSRLPEREGHDGDGVYWFTSLIEPLFAVVGAGFFHTPYYKGEYSRGSQMPVVHITRDGRQRLTAEMSGERPRRAATSACTGAFTGSAGLSAEPQTSKDKEGKLVLRGWVAVSMLSVSNRAGSSEHRSSTRDPMSSIAGRIGICWFSLGRPSRCRDMPNRRHCEKPGGRFKTSGAMDH